jgi:hypothetical protein
MGRGKNPLSAAIECTLAKSQKIRTLWVEEKA